MVYFLWSALILAVDTYSKEAVRKVLPVESKRPVNDHLELWHRENTGVAYGKLKDQPQLVNLLTAALSGGLAVALAQAKGTGTKLGLSCLLGGALGNLLDRLRTGSVTDFIHIKKKHWPIFNLADCFVALGTLLILLSPSHKS